MITGGGFAQIALLHLVLRYMPRMGILPSPWGNLYVVPKGKVTYGTVTYKNCLMVSLHQIGIDVYVPIFKAIDAALAADPKIDAYV